jgi:alpha/beta superfamily hydrolase
MQEEKIYINNGSLIIEGLLFKASEEKAVVICHPHSLMGGSMHNNVVEAIQEAFAAEKITTLRFNFRGVGGSSGYYDEGRGEKEDILAITDYLKKRGGKEIFFAGYSFGAWVGSKILSEKNNPFCCSICVSPPIDYFDFEWNKLKNKIHLMICGNIDQFCEIDTLISEAKKINSTMEIITGADHFYGGKENTLSQILRKFILKKT